jgi:hypothetical protein
MSWRYFLYYFLLTLRNLLLLILCLVLINYAYSWLNESQLTRESGQFANITLLRLFADWDNQTLLAHADTHLQAQLTPVHLQKLETVFQRLQDLVHYNGATGGVLHSSSTVWRPMARYHVQALFKQGHFAVTVTLVRDWGEWKIDTFFYEYQFIPFPQGQGSMKVI